MGSSRDCIVAELQVSEVSQRVATIRGLVRIYASEQCPGRIRTCAHGSGGRWFPAFPPAEVANRQAAWSTHGPRTLGGVGNVDQLQRAGGAISCWNTNSASSAWFQ